MPAWLRNLVMIVGLAVWVAVIAAYLIRDKLPDALLLGVPAALVIALAPPALGRGHAPQPEQPPTPTPPPAVEGQTP